MHELYVNLPQLLINIAISASLFGLFGLSFSCIYSSAHFFHFAHGAIFTIGAYMAFLLIERMHFSIASGTVGAVIISATLGGIIDMTVYRRLRKRQVSATVLLLVSLGVYTVLQNLISVVFGDNTQSIFIGPVREGLEIFDARITVVQICIICASVVLVTAFSVLISYTSIGRAIRAVAADPFLADACGIDSNGMILWASFIGSFLAGIAGVLLALNTSLTPTMGMNALMMGVVVVIVGGGGSIPGIMLGALLLATAQQLGAWYIGSQWQEAIAFGILLIFLFFKPHGFFGQPGRSAKM
jgi:branched-subunit amino acid ABC-type transport system permease component